MSYRFDEQIGEYQRDPLELYQPDDEMLEHLNKDREAVGLEPVDRSDLGTVAKWRSACSEVENAAKVPIKDFPVLEGWVYSACGDRYYKRDDKDVLKEALEQLYIAISPGGGGICNFEDPVRGARRVRMLNSINQLATDLVGGIPAGREEYT